MTEHKKSQFPLIPVLLIFLILGIAIGASITLFSMKSSRGINATDPWIIFTVERIQVKSHTGGFKFLYTATSSEYVGAIQFYHDAEFQLFHIGDKLLVKDTSIQNEYMKLVYLDYRLLEIDVKGEFKIEVP